MQQGRNGSGISQAAIVSVLMASLYWSFSCYSYPKVLLRTIEVSFVNAAY
jgi:hypothetical protein